MKESMKADEKPVIINIKNMAQHIYRRAIIDLIT